MSSSLCSLCMLRTLSANDKGSILNVGFEQATVSPLVCMPRTHFLIQSQALWPSHTPARLQLTRVRIPSNRKRDFLVRRARAQTSPGLNFD